MADGVDAAVEAAEPSGADAVGYLVRAQSGIDELLPADDAMLRIRVRADQPIELVGL